MERPVHLRRRIAGPTALPRLATAVAVALLAGAAPLRAQDILLQTDPPPAEELVCAPAPVTTRVADDQAAAEVERLTDAATQAMILGDLEGALEFLDRALRRDPLAAEALYLRGRILVDRGEPDRAIASFCDYLRIEPGGASAAEARERLEEAVQAGAASDLYQAFARGVSSYASGELEDAAAAFGEVLEARPNAATALYDRAVALGALGRPGAARIDLARYVEVRPETVGSEPVERLRAWLEDGAASPSPGTALALGLVFPGGGQFYTRRPWLGTSLLGLAGGAVAVGYLHEQTTLLCRQPDPDGGCPSDQVAGRESDRPWLVPALGVAAALTVISAIEAAFHARGARRGPDIDAGRGLPSVGMSRLELIRVGRGTALRVDLLRIPIGGT